MNPNNPRPIPDVTHQFPHVTRREATAWMLASAGLALGALSGRLNAQPATAPASGPASGPANTPATILTKVASPLDNYMTRGRTRDRTLKVDIYLDGYQTAVEHIRRDQLPEMHTLKFQSAAIVFPVLNGTASSKTDIDNVKGVMSFDDRPRDTTPVYNEDYHSGTRLGKWELRDLEGRQAQLSLEIPMTSWETVFDEQAARDFPWPANDQWSKVAQSTFNPQMFVDRLHPIVDQKLTQWTSGKNPRSLPPVQLAKFLCGKVVESLQPSGSGYVSNRRTGQFAGLDLKGAAQTLIDGRGTEHDIVCALAALYRTAGLPARTVIGHDLSETKGQRSTPFDKNAAGSGPHLRSWVEFALYDPAADTTLWVPVDPVRIRGFSSRTQPLDKPWKFFGSHDELDDVLPFAFQFHPPTTVVAQGAVAFWGWLTIPETQVATQWLKFSSVSTPQGPGVRKPGQR